MKQLPRLLLRLTVLAVYTVASLTVGLFHNHSAHGSCGCCEQHAEPEPQDKVCQHGHCRLHKHGHAHEHGHAHHHVHAHTHNHAQPDKPAESESEQHQHPGHCDDCAACQFLAAVPPLVQIATFKAVDYHQPFVASPLPLLDGEKLPRLHLARGPPQQG